MLTDSCVTFFFFLSRGVLSVILEDEYLTSVAGTKEEHKAGCNQLPPHDLVYFKLELMPNYLNSYLKNTGCWSTGYVFMPALSESSILPKFLEKSNPEVARPAFSTWLVQNSWTIRHLRYVPWSNSTSQHKNLCRAGLGFWTDNGHDTLISGFGSTCIPQVPLVENLPRCNKRSMLRFQSTMAPLTQSGLPVSRLVFIISSATF